MSNIRISSSDLNQYPALKELRTNLTLPLQEAINKNGVEVAQDIPGDGVLFIHFGQPPDGHHGWSHTLQIDQTGKVLSLREQQGVSHPSTKPTFSLSPEGTSKLLSDLFGKFALRRTVVSSRDARDFWDSRLAKYDVCNEKGFRTNRKPGPAGDGQIDHVDILTYAELKSTPQKRVLPEQVEKEILEIIKAKK